MARMAAIDQLLAPLIADPQNSAVMLDVDGTLAPIVNNADAATVPAATRDTLAMIATKYGAVVCVTGRQCKRAREMVGLSDITYFGNHGSELMRARTEVVEVVPEAEEWKDRVHAFGATMFEKHDLKTLEVRTEDKGAILGLHWRGVSDEQGVEDVMHEIAFAAKADGLAVHFAKKILEIRPPLVFSKGSAVAQVLDEHKYSAALFAGDDFTDIHAFEALDEAITRGRIEHATKIGVDSDEVPAEVVAAADVMVSGTKAVAEMLEMLAAA
jgi:trehalose 6-phosphate phosphatase